MAGCMLLNKKNKKINNEKDALGEKTPEVKGKA